LWFLKKLTFVASLLEKELEAVTKLKVIRQQLYVASEWKRRYDDKLVMSSQRDTRKDFFMFFELGGSCQKYILTNVLPQ